MFKRLLCIFSLLVAAHNVHPSDPKSVDNNLAHSIVLESLNHAIPRTSSIPTTSSTPNLLSKLVIYSTPVSSATGLYVVPVVPVDSLEASPFGNNATPSNEGCTNFINKNVSGSFDSLNPSPVTRHETTQKEKTLPLAPQDESVLLLSITSPMQRNNANNLDKNNTGAVAATVIAQQSSQSEVVNTAVNEKSESLEKQQAGLSAFQEKTY